MLPITRRQFLQTTAATVAAASLPPFSRAFVPPATMVPPGDRPAQDKSVQVLNPRGRVPLSFILDDSTCLVNMGAFCMPQFRAAFPQNPHYWKPWKSWPREIPTDFVREFGDFCAEQGVRGKYSLIPYPACVGWLDRDLPGWSKQDLTDNLAVHRDLIAPRFDLTPEMVTHTRVIDMKTGRAIAEVNSGTMENSFPGKKLSADELASYIAYALRILKNCDLPTVGVTTPGGFGNACKSELSQAMGQALRDVFQAEIPFYFKYITDEKENLAPRLEHVEGIVGPDATTTPKLTVNVPAGTGDWFGNWDGDNVPQGDKYITADWSAGRMVDMIDRGGPAIMFGHWQGMFCNGTKRGFEACKKVITTVNEKYRDRTVWMKASELARYQAARELTRIERAAGGITLTAPFACPMYTVRIGTANATEPKLTHAGQPVVMKEVDSIGKLVSGTWMRDKEGVVACFDLPKGTVVIAT